MKYNKCVLQQTQKMYEKAEALTDIMATIVVEANKTDANSDKTILCADSALQTILELRDLNSKLMEMLGNDMWINRLQNIVADLPPGLISVTEDEYENFNIYVEGQLYSEHMSYDNTYFQLNVLKRGFELGQAAHKEAPKKNN